MAQARQLADSIESIVVGAVGLTARALADADPGSELTFSQWRALVIVGASDDGARVGEVAARIGITSPATGRLLQRMRRRGLITLSTDEGDRRATVARLTTVGSERRSAIVAYRQRALRSLVEDIPPRRRAELSRAATRIADSFSQYS